MKLNVIDSELFIILSHGIIKYDENLLIQIRDTLFLENGT